MNILTKVAVFLLLGLNLSLFSQWNIIDSGTTEELNAITFSNTSNGIIVGDDGVILHSTDGGETWENRESGTLEDLNDVMFPVENIGYAVGKYGVILKTIDFGMTWNSIETGFYDKLFTVFFTDEDIGYSLGRYGFLVKTTDGGENWEVIDIGTDEDFYDIYFINNDLGFIVGNGSMVLKTENGGVDWIDVSLAGPLNWNSVSFLDENIGYLIGNKVYKTVNSGEEWFLLDIQFPTWNINFVSEEVAFRYYASNAIEKTVDSGIYWSKETNPSGSEINSTFFLDEEIGFMVGEDGSIIKTINGGGNHFLGSLPSNDSIFQTDEFCLIEWETDILDDFNVNIDLYHSGDFVMNIASEILVHNSKGKFNWMIPEIEMNLSNSKIIISSTEVDIVPLEINIGLLQENDMKFYKHELSGELSEMFISYMQFYNDKLWLCGTNGNIAYSGDDNFENWTVVNNGIENTERLSWMDQIDINIYVTVSNSGKIYRTVDSGLNWETVFYNPTMTSCLRYVKSFPETGEIIVVGDGIDEFSNKVFLYSNDYGLTWINNNDFLLGDIYPWQIIFDSSTSGYSIGDTGSAFPSSSFQIYKTDDFGLTWREMNPFSPDNKLIYSLSFNGELGMVRSSSEIAITSDGGENWTINLLDANYPVVRFIDDNNALCGSTFIGFNEFGEIMNSKKMDHVNYKGSYSFFDNESNGFICGGNYQYGWFSSTIPPRTIDNNNEIEITDYKLFQNYPNPFNTNTTIKFDIPRESNIDLKIYNVKGELVQTLIDRRNLQAGTHEIKFNANKLTSGQYFYQLKAENSIITTKKMLFLK